MAIGTRQRSTYTLARNQPAWEKQKRESRRIVRIICQVLISFVYGLTTLGVPAGTKRNVDSPLAAYSTLRESKSANLDLNSPSQMQPSPVLTTSTGAYVIPVRRTTQTSQKLQEAMDSVIQALRDKRDISEQLVANLLSSVENLLSLSKEIVQYCYYTEAISKTSAIFRVIIAMHEMVGQHCVIKDEIDEIFWCLGVYKTDIGEPNK